MTLDRHGSREAFLSGDLKDHRPVPHLGERPWIAVVVTSGDGPRVALSALWAEFVERHLVSSLERCPRRLHPDC